MTDGDDRRTSETELITAGPTQRSSECERREETEMVAGFWVPSNSKILPSLDCDDLSASPSLI